MVFDQLARDIVSIIKPTGDKIDNIKANVQPNIIFINDKTLILEDGDRIARILPNGLIENYIVLENGFYHGGNGLPGGYQAKVRKETSSNQTNSSPALTNIYNIEATNSNINLNPNNSHINNTIYGNSVFSKIREEINSKIDDEDLKTKVMHLLSEMEQSTGSSSFTAKYSAFISALANHVAIIAPFIPALATMAR